LALIRRQASQRGVEIGGIAVRDRGLLRGDCDARNIQHRVEVQLIAATAIPIRHHVVGDGEEPRLHVLDAGPVQTFQRIQEDLIGRVLDPIVTAESTLAVAIDAIDIPAVDFGEGSRVGCGPRREVLVRFRHQRRSGASHVQAWVVGQILVDCHAASPYAHG
jgi:hypothetical protein